MLMNGNKCLPEKWENYIYSIYVERLSVFKHVENTHINTGMGLFKVHLLGD